MSNVNLMSASNQWANRPADERFSNPQDLLDAMRARRARAAVAVVPFGALAVAPMEDARGLVLTGSTGQPAGMSNWAFEQLCARIGAPADHYASLPSTLVAPVINHLIGKAEDRGKESMVLFDQNGGLLVRAFTGTGYGRFWDEQIASRLIDLQGQGWRVPPARPVSAGQPGARPATEQDVLDNRDGGGGLSINVGDMIAPAGLYAGDRDLFAFMVNEKVRIEDGTEGGLSRGFFIQNSEVGKAALKITAFLYRHVCGNHIVWGAESVRRLSIRHTKGNLDAMFSALQVRLVEYATAGVEQDQLRVKQAQQYQIAGTKEDVIDALFNKAILTRRALDAAYDTAEQDGENPRTAWGMAQGVTRNSQQQANADRRAAMDNAAGQILQIAF